jgi:uncharacterized membrane protein
MINNNRTESPRVILTHGDGTRQSAFYRAWQSLKDFLGIPLLMSLTALGLSWVLYRLDRQPSGWIQPLRSYLLKHILTTPDTTGALLGLIAGGLFTQTSIVISMLLLALQQSASTMGNLIYDQFLRRHRNQVYVGYVIGTLLIALTLRTTVYDEFNPVVGATVNLVMGIAAIVLLVWFLYATIHQMRPEIIVETIHDMTDKTRGKQQAKLNDFRSQPQLDHPPKAVVKAETHGFLSVIDFDAAKQCVRDCGPDTEVVFQVHIGDYVTHHSSLVEIKAPDAEEAASIARCVSDTLHFGQQRRMDHDPRYGVKQLESIGWTEMSTAKDNPETSLLVLYVLDSLLTKWIAADSKSVSDSETVPIVYEIHSCKTVLDVWESLLVVSSESMQHQAFAEILRSIARIYPDLPPDLRNRADQMLRRATSAMGDHVLTQDLNDALHKLIRTLERSDRHLFAQTIAEAHHKFAASLGTLGNRSTRVKQGESG